MRFFLIGSRVHLAVGLAVFIVVSVILAQFEGAEAHWSRSDVCPDFVCFWSAAKNLVEGKDPYNPLNELREQRDLESAMERSVIDKSYVPYYYPPWFGLLFTALLPFGFPAAKSLYFVLNIMLVITSCFLVRSILKSDRTSTFSITLAFFPAVISLLLGQSTPIVFFIAVALWHSLERQKDVLAGALIAWLTVKPQLTAFLIVGSLIWVVRQRRWMAVVSFFLTLNLLLAVSSLVLPSWPVLLLRSTVASPLITDKFPWMGTTWLLVLRTLGLRSWLLWSFYLALATPLAWSAFKTAASLESSPKELMASSVLVAFFITPYSQSYDFLLLLIPLHIFLRGGLSETVNGLVLAALLIVPYIQQMIILLLMKNSHIFDIKKFLNTDEIGIAQPGFTFFWMPLLLLLAWLSTRPLKTQTVQD